MRAKGTEAASRVQTTMTMQKELPGVSFRETAQFLLSGSRSRRVLRWEGRIGQNTAPPYEFGER